VSKPAVRPVPALPPKYRGVLVHSYAYDFAREDKLLAQLFGVRDPHSPAGSALQRVAVAKYDERLRGVHGRLDRVMARRGLRFDWGAAR
jgi:hypothetical protein